MGIINILDKQTANLIAAGEVVERPSSAIKEMLENCADAGATSITVEIKNGGTSFIRITDNGKGMSREDVPKAIMRHATSKIKDSGDLEAIATFGFRGEALAAISSVSTMRILTRQKDDVSGTRFECEFGEQTILEDAGCPEGTTITVENIFQNVPARRKFLKKDSTEAMSVSAVCEKFALSRPDISVTLISDNNIKLQTPGDNKLEDAIYACLGREFASKMLPCNYTYSSITVHGFIGKPEFCRPNRNMQNFFVNNRHIRSKTMLASLEEAFRSFCPVGKFPACVLFCDIDLRLVDVNVHPAKLEIKFSDERKIFDAVYFAVKNALSSGATFKEFETEIDKDDFYKIPSNAEKSPQNEPSKESVSTIHQSYSDTSDNSYINFDNNAFNLKTYTSVPFNSKEQANNSENKTVSESFNTQKNASENSSDASMSQSHEFINTTTNDSVKNATDTKNIQQNILLKEDQEEIISENSLAKPLFLGEAFNTYILAQYKNSLYIIDKHAAHERIIYEKLKNPEYKHSSQYLLEPISVVVTPKEADAIIENKNYFTKTGFEFDEFGINTFIIRALPLPINQANAKDVFTFLAGKLAEGNSRSAGEIFDRALFTAACRAAIKGGDTHTDIDNIQILDEIFNNDAILYCPHGRPVICEFTKTKLEKMFDRL